jgi:Tfp pilus assembly protein PilO
MFLTKKRRRIAELEERAERYRVQRNEARSLSETFRGNQARIAQGKAVQHDELTQLRDRLHQQLPNDVVELQRQLRREKTRSAALEAARAELQEQNEALCREAVDRAGTLSKETTA